MYVHCLPGLTDKLSSSFLIDLLSLLRSALYSALDRYVTRAGNVVGMGPRELLNVSYYDAGGEGRGDGPWGVYHGKTMRMTMRIMNA
jgi:hypothetical protein